MSEYNSKQVPDSLVTRAVKRHRERRMFGNFELLYLELLLQSGYAGSIPIGKLVDRRCFPEAAPIPYNLLHGVAEPKMVDVNSPFPEGFIGIFTYANVAHILNTADEKPTKTEQNLSFSERLSSEIKKKTKK